MVMKKITEKYLTISLTGISFKKGHLNPKGIVGLVVSLLL
jgi:hypothetical protein